MNVWAASPTFDCNFLCICVLGDRSAVGLAREMGKEGKLSHCVNGFIDNHAGMPGYGQLGCKGFIVLDKNHKVVSRSTSAFMEVRDVAFKHVESLLHAVCAGKPLPPVCPGEYVQIIQAPADKPKLSGAQALCVEVKEDLLTLVLLQGSFRGKAIQVPESTVKQLSREDPSDSDEEANAGGGQKCSQGNCGQGGCGDQGGCDAALKAAQGGCNQGACNEGGCNQGGCNQGGYPGGDSDSSSDAIGDEVGDAPVRRVEPAFVNNALQLVSVKVPSMDAEHDECATALRRLAATQSVQALQAAMDCLLEHFDHEEALFDQYGFGGNVNEAFSAKKTHIEDHRRITDKMQRQIAEKKVSPDFIEEVLQDFHDHTSRYDVQYSELLSSKGAA
jgi:hemerythrin